jgi:hypothetical protein
MISFKFAVHRRDECIAQAAADRALVGHDFLRKPADRALVGHDLLRKPRQIVPHQHGGVVLGLGHGCPVGVSVTSQMLPRNSALTTNPRHLAARTVTRAIITPALS